ncbi:cobalamin B12-binding domain-containing protein [Sporomusa sp.]|uniref:cobalamin B12-binding domain-containing protein n=1 Tax=Sporomusa sp. TaxID=2078658 RepID=UPI002B96EB44|nr:cobalamin-dependent protein [Sporomusa sp.]HWR42098.1 cobalamin-dependent protein [Sporomusa sp.]
MSVDLDKISQALGELDEQTLMGMLEEFLTTNPTQEEAMEVVKACQDGMVIVGNLFEKSEYYVGDLIFSGEILQAAIELLKPVLGNGSDQKVGKLLLGTVQGDIHDIGKNIFRSMVEAAGFEVNDIGVDVPAATFVAKVKEWQPDVVGMAGVLTLALEGMKDTVEAIEAAGLRDKVKILVGGTPVTAESCKRIGADGWTTNAAKAVRICKDWMGR